MAEPLRRWRELIGEEVASTWLVCDIERRRSLGKDVEAVPWREVGEVCLASLEGRESG
jgi:hypothetical protein